MVIVSDKLALIIRSLASGLAPGQEGWLVGGTVRDWLLGRDTGDIDLAVSRSAGEFAARAAALFGGAWFVMDAERDVFRVVMKEGRTQLDVSPLKGSINEDLAARDFTINAMAIKLEGALSVIDPFGGQTDLQKKQIRALDREALSADPLRMLRAFRLAGTLGFGIEKKTLAYIKELATLVSSVSEERVREELYLMLERPGASEVFGKMSRAGLLKEVLPETAAMAGLPQGEAHRHDLLTHPLKTMEYAELVMDDLRRYFGAREHEVREYLGIAADGPLTNRGLVKLAALLHDVGKPRTMTNDKGRIRFTGHDEEGAAINAGIAGRLKLSRRASAALAQVTSGHMRPLHMSYGVPTRHAVYRYVRDMGENLPASLIVALADAMATRDNPDFLPTDVEGLVLDLAECYYGEYRKARAKPLIKGQDLIDVFGMKPGPPFKVILGDVEERRAAGLLKDRDEALEYVRRRLVER